MFIFLIVSPFQIPFRGQSHRLSPSSSSPGVTPSELLPATDGFLTYEGSSTLPGCGEGVTWVLPNRQARILDESFQEKNTLQYTDCMIY